MRLQSVVRSLRTTDFKRTPSTSVMCAFAPAEKTLRRGLEHAGPCMRAKAPTICARAATICARAATMCVKVATMCAKVATMCAKAATRCAKAATRFAQGPDNMRQGPDHVRECRAYMRQGRESAEVATMCARAQQCAPYALPPLKSRGFPRFPDVSGSAAVLRESGTVQCAVY